jgi:hypothetical protein
MKLSYFVLSCSFMISFLLTHSSTLWAFDSEKRELIRIAKSEKKATQGDPGAERDRVIEEYEKEKLAKFKRNIGRRYLVVRKVRPVEFHKDPEDTQRTFTVPKEKEGFLITEVIQNHSGSMYFYRVVFDSGQTGYLMADGNYLELKTLEGSLIPLTRKANAKGKGWASSKGTLHQAVTLVKNHLIRVDPMTGQRVTVESRMAEAKARFFPTLTWRYEVQEIGDHRCRVFQYSEGEEKPSLIRTWIIDFSTLTVHPENQAAQNLYR